MTLEIMETKLHLAKKTIKTRLEMLNSLMDSRRVLQIYSMEHTQICDGITVVEAEITALKRKYSEVEQEYLKIYREVEKKYT